jgi:cytochrome P450
VTELELLVNSEAILVAGHETTAAVAAWLLHELSHNPSLLQTIREEVAAVVPSGWKGIDNKNLNELVLTRRLVNEVLRVKSPSVLNGWDCVKDFKCKDAEGNDVIIPKGSSGFILPRKIGLMEFSDQINLEKDQSHLSFGGGGRICPGRHLAMMELVLFTAMLTQYEFSGEHKQCPKEQLNFTMIPTKFEVGLKPLND